MEKVYGNIQGLKSSQIKQLQRLYDQRQESDRFVTPEFASLLAAISTEIHHPVCSYINRRGHIVRVAVGTPEKTQIPPQELPRHSAERLSGIHCVATQFKSVAPDEASLVAMVRQRLDALVVLNVADSKATGIVKQVYLAHPVPEKETPWVVSPPLSLDDIAGQDFDELVHEWESEFSQSDYGTL